MQRDLRSLADTTFDLLVIGGGIYGAAAAWDATQRGLAVALVDREDFGGGTSFNSAKTLHGGVRSLQSGNITELRLFVRERRALSNIVPHLVQPLPFVMPTYARVERNRWLMRLYFAVNDLIAHDRNLVRDPALHLPSSRLLSRDDCLALSPSIDPTGVTGGIEWHDCQMYNSDRVTLSFLLSAAEHGAVVVNHAEVTGLVWHGDRLRTARVTNRAQPADPAVSVDTETFDVRARVVLNCAGPWAPELLANLAPQAVSAQPQPLSKALNLITRRRIVTTHAVAAQARDRLLFIVPWRDCAIVGTSHDPFDGSTSSFSVISNDVERFLLDINLAFPGLGLKLADVALVHRGLLPATNYGEPVNLLKTSGVRDHRADGAAGVISVLGVRYTTARDTAQRAVDLVFEVLDQAPPPCRTAHTPIAGGDISSAHVLEKEVIDAVPAHVTASTAIRLARSYGRHYRRVLDQLVSTPADARPLGANCDVTRGEVRHAVRAEMALTLRDAVLRRTEAASAGHPGDDTIRAAAAVMSEELGWSTERTEQEILEVEAVLRIPD